MRGISWVALAVLVVAAAILPACNDYIVYPAPRIQALNPTFISAQNPMGTFNLVVTGFQFTPSSIIQWNGVPLVTTFTSVNQITGQVPANLFASPGSIAIDVFTPQPGGGTSSVLYFTVTPQKTLTPQITSVSPAGVLAGSGAFALFITGSNFLNVSTVTVNGDNRAVTFVNASSLQVQIQAADVANAGMVPIVVLNPVGSSSGGGSSAPFNLAVNNPVPTVSTMTPANFTAGTTANTAVTVAGSNLVPGSQIEIDGTPPASGTTFGSTTQLGTVFTGGFLASAGVHTLQVVNPAPGGGSSNVITFAVNPTLTAGLPELLDVGYLGAEANQGICGSNCAAGPPTLATAGPAISSNGATVVFASSSTNLLFNQPNPGSNIFARTTCVGNGACTPTTNIVSAGPNQLASNGSSFEPSLDSAGTHAAFTSLASNLVGGITFASGNRQVYWMNVCTGASNVTCAAGQMVSLSPDGVTPGNGDSYNPSISPDGRYVAFASLATNLVAGVNTLDGITPQIFLRDTCNGATTGCTPTTYLISTPDGTTPGNGASSEPSVSSTAVYVSFTSSASNLGATAPNANGNQEIFIRTVCLVTVTSSCAPFNTLVSTPDGVTPANGTSSASKVASAGRFVTFASTGTNLLAGIGPTQQIYMYDTCLTGNVITTGCSPAIYLVSTADGTTPGNALSETPSISLGSTTVAANSTSGEFIAFGSRASNLGFSTQNGVENVYVRKMCVGLSASIVCTPLTTLATQGGGAPSQQAGNTPEQSNGDSIMPAISADAHTVAFLSSANNLVVPQTTNGFANLFLGLTSF